LFTFSSCRLSILIAREQMIAAFLGHYNTGSRSSAVSQNSQNQEGTQGTKERDDFDRSRS